MRALLDRPRLWLAAGALYLVVGGHLSGSSSSSSSHRVAGRAGRG